MSIFRPFSGKMISYDEGNADFHPSTREFTFSAKSGRVNLYTLGHLDSILLVCNWPHSVGQNHFIIMMLFNRDSAIQKSFQKILHGLQVRKFGSLLAVRTTCHTVRTLICQSIIRLDDENFPSGRPSVSRSFEQFKFASVRT
jgi:hypothetical protein